MKQEVLDAYADYTADQDKALNQESQNHTRKKILPESGRYQSTFHDYTAFAYSDKETGETKRAIKLFFRVEEGEKAGLIMERTYWENQYDRAAFFDAVAVLAGVQVMDVLAGLSALDAQVGKTCVTKVARGTSKKGNDWESLDLVG